MNIAQLVKKAKETDSFQILVVTPGGRNALVPLESIFWGGSSARHAAIDALAEALNATEAK